MALRRCPRFGASQAARVLLRARVASCLIASGSSLAIFAPFAVGAPESDPPATQQPKAPRRTAAAKEIEWATIRHSDLPKGISITGDLKRAIRWTDKRGENFAVFVLRTSERKIEGDELATTRRISARHFVRAGGKGKPRLKREVNDGFVDCPQDLEVDFVPEAFGVTDEDADQIGELSFAYRLGCRSDVSPLDLKLLILEDGDKYILRGTTRIPGEEPEGGDYVVDPSFAKGPPAFLERAKGLWARIVTDRFGDPSSED